MATDLQTWIEENGRTAAYRRLAHRCGVSWQTAQYWTRRNRIPARHLAVAEDETGLPRQILNPEPFQKLAVAAGAQQPQAALETPCPTPSS